jgi:hypothetical protein
MEGIFMDGNAVSVERLLMRFLRIVNGSKEAGTKTRI